MKLFERFEEIKQDNVLPLVSHYFSSNNQNIDVDGLVSFLYDNHLGYLAVEQKESLHFCIFLEIGKFFNGFEFNRIEKFFKGTPLVKSSRLLEKYVRTEVANVVPNTFVFFTDLAFGDWFKDTSFIKEMLDSHPCYNLVTISSEEVSDEDISASNDSREFSFESNVKVEKDSWWYDYVSKSEVANNLFLYTIARYPDLLEIYDDYRNKTIPMILPLDNPLESKEEYKGKGIEITLNGFETKNNLYFNSKFGARTKALLYKEVDFFTFYDCELSLNLFNVFEGVRVYKLDGETYQSLFYYSYIDDKKHNTYDISDLEDNTKDEVYEDKMISDIYTVVPIRYEDIDILRSRSAKDNNFVVNNVITGLCFQDHYEFGKDSGNIVKNSERIERIDLGSIQVMITEEPHYNYYKKTPTCVIAPQPLTVRLMVAVDKETHSGVLYLLNLGVKVKPTKYLDEVTRNGIAMKVTDEKYCKGLKTIIADDGTEIVNLYNYLDSKFDIQRVGVPRNLILSPFLADWDNAPQDSAPVEKCRQIKSSILYGEALFDDGEELGKIVDKKLEDSFKEKYGVSVYDYNTMNVSKVNILQFSDTYKDYLAERIDFAVVNLFYLELVQLEESAIQVANVGISKFVNSYKLNDKSIKGNGKKNTSSKFVLDKLEEIQEEYTKTLDFWEAQTNYYSSNVTMTTLRNKFEVEKDLNRLKRNHREIQQIYDNRQQNASSRSGLILSIAGIILTLLNVIDIYTAAAGDPGESQYLTFIERVFFENISTVNVIRIALAVVCVVYLFKFIMKSYLERKKK